MSEELKAGGGFLPASANDVIQTDGGWVVNAPIVILDDGKVHAVGNHDTLLATDPIYQEIYHSQVKGGDGHGQTHQ